MKSVRVVPRFKCDFCKYRSTKSVMEKHEKRCFRNPNRFCDFCENKEVVVETIADIGGETYTEERPCPYCSKFDPKIKKEIEEREKTLGTIQEIIKQDENT